MSRRVRPEKRITPADPRFNSVMVGQFINRVMVSGKKSTAERICYGALDLVEQRAKRAPLEVFEAAIRNATPVIEVKPRRVGGATLQVPVEIRSDRRLALAMRWLIQNARKRPGKTFAEKLASELMDTANNQGNTIKKKEDTHKMAEANRAFAHYRF